MRCHLILLSIAVISALNHPACAQVLLPEAQAELDRQTGQISEYVRRVFQDRDGAYWFGTNGEGVCRYDGKSLEFFSFKEGLAGTAIRGIAQDQDGAMWFATEGGVSRFQNGAFTNYTTRQGLSHNEVWYLMIDRAGVVWVGTQGGACRFNGESFTPFPIPRAQVENPESRFSPLLIWSIYEDADGAMWFGTDGEGVRKFDGKQFTTFTTKDGLAGNQVRCIISDRHGHIWIGAESGGLSRFDGKTFQNFTSENGLSGDRVWTLLEDREGNLWISTLGKGVTRYDGATFTRLGVAQGLVSLHPLSERSNIHVQSIFQDRDGVLWFGCSGGLFRFDGTNFINVTRAGPWP